MQTRGIVRVVENRPLGGICRQLGSSHSLPLRAIDADAFGGHSRPQFGPSNLSYARRAGGHAQTHGAERLVAHATAVAADVVDAATRLAFDAPGERREFGVGVPRRGTLQMPLWSHNSNKSDVRPTPSTTLTDSTRRAMVGIACPSRQTPNQRAWPGFPNVVRTPMSTNPSFQNYQTYLKLGELLSLQQPLSRAHDETLFIIVHQVYELWFKCMLHELEHSGDLLSEDQPDRAASTLKRALRIVKVLVSQLDIIETMTPLEFGAFRERLGASSGFQSVQFREIEFILGYKRPSVLQLFPERSPERQRLEARIVSPTLWDEFVGLLARSGHSIPAKALRKWTNCPVGTDAEVQAALIRIYRDDPKLTAFCESLVDLDEGMQEWRYRHLKMVQRTIGTKTGTGGSSGAEYLLSTVLAGPFFPDLWEVRDRF